MAALHGSQRASASGSTILWEVDAEGRPLPSTDAIAGLVKERVRVSDERFFFKRARPTPELSASGLPRSLSTSGLCPPLEASLQIRRVLVQRFRCIEALTWFPQAGLNVLIGPGDTGKTALLDAIALALSPAPVQGAEETDYCDLDTERGFSVELVVGELSPGLQSEVNPAPLWGWDAGQRELLRRPVDRDGVEAALCVRVVGTKDLEVVHELIQPGAAPRRLSATSRGAFSMWSVGVGRSPDAELRMRRGTLLERALGGDLLRGPASGAMRSATSALELPDETTEALARVSGNLKVAGVPTDGLSLGLVPTTGQSPVASFGLITRQTDGAFLPFSTLGRGSKQLAMVALAAERAPSGAIALADELETGLEPYRQRRLMGELRRVISTSGQSFITTHSPTVLGCLSGDELSRVQRPTSSPSIVQIRGKRASALIREQPEALLSRLPVICEGVTEVGFLHHMLTEVAGLDESMDALGIYLANGGGHHKTLTLIRELFELGIPVMGFVDEEFELSGTREALRAAGVALGGFTEAQCTEEAVVNELPTLSAVDSLLSVPGRDHDERLPDSRRQQVSNRLARDGNLSMTELASTLGDEAVRDAVWRTAHKAGWFKSTEAGRNLASYAATAVSQSGDIFTTLQAFWAQALDRLR